MDAFCSAHFCVDAILRHALFPLFSEICQHKELTRGSRSCGPLWAAAAGTSQTCAGVVWSGQFLRCEVRKRRGPPSPYFTPITLAECVGKHRSRSLRVWLDVFPWLIQASHQVVQAEGYRSRPHGYPDDEKGSCSRCHHFYQI